MFSKFPSSINPVMIVNSKMHNAKTLKINCEMKAFLTGLHVVSYIAGVSLQKNFTKRPGLGWALS